MEKTLLMAVDLGTSFIKSIVYDTQGNMVAGAVEPTKDERPGPGVFIQRGDDLFASVVACMKSAAGQLGARAADVEAISFTGQMAGFMGVDRDWNDVTTWSCSLDTRYMPYAERQMKELKTQFLRISGTNLPQMAPKVAWFQSEFPEESKRVAKYLMISGYVLGRLGALSIDDAVIDATYTTWTGLADIARGAWSEEICAAVGVESAFLPKIVQSDSICGHLSAKMAAETGLKSGIALVSGAGDKPASCLGCDLLTPGDMNFEASSYGAVHCCVEEYRPDMEQGLYDCIPGPVAGTFYVTEYVPGSGITLDWFLDKFMPRDGRKKSELFAELERDMADIPPGCGGLMAIGLLGGSAMPADGDLRGMWMGFDWSHTKAHFYKALLESFSYDFARTIDRIEQFYPEYKTDMVKVMGGGAKSAYWTQMNADVTGKTYQVLDRDDMATWGSAILAGSAIGVFGDMGETARRYTRVKTEYAPAPGMKVAYAPFKELYGQYVGELPPYFARVRRADGTDK